MNYKIIQICVDSSQIRNIICISTTRANRDYMGISGITWDYMGLQEIIGDYRGLHRITGDSMELRWIHVK